MAIITAGAAFFQVDSSGRVDGGGTIASTGTSVTGTTTTFNTDIPNTAGVPDNPSFIIAGSDPEQARLVTDVTSDTALTIDKAFDTDLAATTAYDIAIMEKLLNVSNVTGPSESANRVNISTYGTTGIAQFAAGLRTPGDWSFDLFFEPKLASHQRFETRYVDGDELPYVLFYPDSAAGTDVPDLSNSRKYAIGFISNFDADGPTDGAFTQNVTITLTGNVSTVAGVDP